MAPKKKDKGKLSDWMECSLCGKLVSSQDAEAHSTSCDSDHGNIQGSVFHGKVIRAEGYRNEDGSVLTPNIRDRDSIVWLAVSTMQMCGLSIGQPCVVNQILVKRSWPLKQLPLSKVVLTDQSIMELGIREEDTVTVERFFPNENLVQSMLLTLREPSDVFEKAEFLSFITSYLDGKYVTQGSPVTVKYFGQVCRCDVSSLICDKPALPCDRTTPGHAPHAQSQAAECVKAAGSQTPQRHTLVDVTASTEGSSPLADGNVLSTPTQDVSKSVADLDIASLTISPTTSTPKMRQRDTFPNLMTPVSSTGQSGGFFNTLASEMFARLSSKFEMFARVSSKFTRCSVLSVAGSKDRVDQNMPLVSLADVGGMTLQVEQLKTKICRALQSKCQSRGILLHGPPGTGKSLLVKALTNDLGMPTVYMTDTDIWSKLYGEAESNLRKVFKLAQYKAPSIVVIDAIDVMFPKRSQVQAGQQEHRIVGELLKLLDGLASVDPHKIVVVIGITNNRDSIDPALRRAGRLGCEVEIGVPTAVQRRDILEVVLSKVPHELTAEDVETVARNAHGYVGADLWLLMDEAYSHALSSKPASVPREAVRTAMKDVVYAGLHVTPSSLREMQLEVPQVKWTDIGGMSEVKMRLQEALEWPLTNPEVFSRIGIPHSIKGLLMYGPPGCSKTMVAKALATECSRNFLAVKGPELFNKYVGESEKAVREVFHKARSAAPSIIFFDEFDAIAVNRSSTESGVETRVLSQLLTEMDGVEFLKDVFVIAATNRPDLIDGALLRHGRFDRLVYVPLPDAETRRQILQKQFSKIPVADDVSLEFLVESTQNYSGSEIVQVCQDAGISALREDTEKVLARHFGTALTEVTPRIDPHLLEIYAKFSQNKLSIN